MNRLLIALALLVAGCDETKEAPKDLVPIDKDKPPKDPHAKQKPPGQPDRIEVQHILIAFMGADPRVKATRSRDEAKQLADELLGRAQRGEAIEPMIEEFTDDRNEETGKPNTGGKYTMANFGVESPGEAFPREQMAESFGDVAFTLGVGQVGMADYDPTKSPFGWHIIKRLR